MTNGEKMRALMSASDCVYFYCHTHFCGDCPVYRSRSKLSCRELLERWMNKEAEDDEEDEE